MRATALSLNACPYRATSFPRQRPRVHRFYPGANYSDAGGLVDGSTVVADHARSYDRGAQVEDPAHLADLVAHKRAARQHRVSDALIHAVPAIRDLLVRAAARGHNLGSITAALQRLRQHCTIPELAAAVQEALARDVPHPNAVRLALARQREQHAQSPATVVTLPAHLQQRDVIVRPHDLATYDRLQESPDDHDPV